MSPKRRTALVTTIGERCRTCYTCVRECPAKAIRIVDGQAEIVPERCIGCGNCVRVCSQNAKLPLGSVLPVDDFLAGDEAVAVCLAPSFPAEFDGVEWMRVVGALREMGFTSVHEVAFGADLVADHYRQLLENAEGGERFIASPCPAIISFVERYHPNIADRLAPIVSPMIAMARVVREQYGAETRVVFAGPCIAKKGEAVDTFVADDVDAVLTFTELHTMLDQRGIHISDATPSDFDPPHAGIGALFPISRGLQHAAKMQEDLISGDVMTADGRREFVEAIKEFESGDMQTRLLDILCCEGCIMGAGMNHHVPLFRKRARVAAFVRERMGSHDEEKWQAAMDRYAHLDLERSYEVSDERMMEPGPDDLMRILADMGKMTPEDELNCGACGYDTCREHAVAIHKGLAEMEMCLPHSIERLHDTVEKLGMSNAQLARVQDALMQAEKLASMGQLAAGIAHEINNPLGVVLMMAHVLKDETAESGQANEDLDMIVEQADRCKKIVSGLLHFARQNKVVRQPTDVRELVDNSLKLISRPESVKLEVDHHLTDPMAEIDQDQIVQVLTNLVSNAVAAMPEGGVIRVHTQGNPETLTLTVSDTGVGIPKSNLSKVFEPFFTTKQIGKGTGLGLAVIYGIIKMHRGDIRVTSNADPADGPTGTEFTVTLPRREVPEPAPEVLVTDEDLAAGNGITLT